MPKKNLSKGKTKALLILMFLGVPIIVLSIPIIILVILKCALPSADGYLLTGFSFYVFGSISIIVVPIIFFLLISKKKNRKNDIKKYFKNYKVLFIVCSLIIVVLESAIICRGHEYFKDIIEGPQEAIMMDAVVKMKSSYKSSSSYIIGYIDGEEIQLEVTRDARPNVYRNKSYKMVRAKYYKNIKEVYDIDVYISYVEDEL